ncbi:hypothetical protein G5V59_17260 [Nocardioides sp. W3-2-3]|uniref:hypothetical protein n=1 Tax=Nocardioides convexus TaxID=2712224 RepID=UPI0024181928|nr:hypothetical protein [Nocardioides convexus]NHA01045.1 hypothetical protein [Nocardioides convexus]
MTQALESARRGRRRRRRAGPDLGRVAAVRRGRRRRQRPADRPVRAAQRASASSAPPCSPSA